MASLREQVLRRKPVTAMAEETGADTEGGELARTISLPRGAAAELAEEAVAEG